MKRENVPVANQPTAGRLDPAVVKIAIILIVGGLAPLFDTTIMNVALNSLSSDLHAPISTIQWVMTGYLLALGMIIPITGWAAGRLGNKRMWMMGLALFLMGSILSALSWNIASLITFRVLQGLGGGIMIPMLTTMIMQAAGGRKLGSLMSIISLPALLGPILGPVFGGIIVNDLSWRWIFYVNVPICIAALILAWIGLPADQPAQQKQKLDVIGFVLLSPALVALLYSLGQVGSQGGFAKWDVCVPLIIGAVLLIAFIVYALTTRSAPLVDLRLFRIRSFTGASVLLFLTGLATYGAMLLLPLYYQQICGKSVLTAGFMLIPQGVGSLLSRGWAGKLSDSRGPRLVVLLSSALCVIGTLPFALAGPHTNSFLLAAALIVRGIGLSGANIAVMSSAFQGLRKEEIPHASTATRIAQQLGGAFGAAVFAVILDHQLTAHGVSGITAQSSAFDNTFWWSIGFIALAFIFAFLLPREKRERAL
ncbi:MDR family MFS transporter [Alicyclobacillus kakegawensis]|uniref:MDR family MFS transporter n=1 Tax=Alicyclobacillus kakegawensis TaxID=392012 RepID=UPI000A8950E7|nr:MDR family MFS transporter [Alicyclobacillus kakegawensis]